MIFAFPFLTYFTECPLAQSMLLQMAILHFFLWLSDSPLENPMDGGAWWAVVHGVAKSQTRLSDLTN